MKQKIPCFCDNTFTVEYPEEIDLDARPEYLGEIMDGSFMNFICTSCGKKHKPEFPITVVWPSRGIRLEAVPELDRGEFYRKKDGQGKAETVIGYPEMADRIAVFRDGLDPLVIEAIKYYLLLKAEESYPDKEINIWYQHQSSGFLELHLHGFNEDEIAVTRVPMAVYEKTAQDYKKNPKEELFKALRSGSYLSVQNMRRFDGH
ncbi:MAG: CpXC domain-containing protein [Treponema sp.]|nr:CpXC domain-containing protein [Treponema sp.]